MRTFTLLLALGVVLMAACGKSPRHATYWDQYDQLGKLLTGSYALEEEGQRTSGRLHIADVSSYERKWIWLYAEWCDADASKKPTRQLMLRLVQFPDRTAGLEVYEIPGVQKYAGAWSDPRRLRDLTEENLVLKEGCTLLFAKADRGQPMIGSTDGAGCAGRTFGGLPRTIRIEVTKDRLLWSDRVLDDEGKPIAGTQQTFVKTVNTSFR